MNLYEARRVEFVRAVESEDADFRLLTPEDRDQANAAALSSMAGQSGSKADENFIVRRAGFLADRIATRHPGISALFAQARWPRWATVALAILAFVTGMATNELGNDKRLDVLALPLLGTIAWNAAVYVALLIKALRSKSSSGGQRLPGALARWAQSGRGNITSDPALARAVAAFRQRWAVKALPLFNARSAGALHLAAALFGLGVVAGIYLRALVIEYRAGWESTFLGPDFVHLLLTIILGPASVLTGEPIPSVNEIAAMNWSGAPSGGVNAGPWINLYSATLAGFVILPRLLLAGWCAGRAYRFARHVPMPGREDFYVRRLVRSARQTPASVRITPYACTLGDGERSTLEGALQTLLGERARINFDAAVEWGSEDAWIARHEADPDDDYRIALFSLSSTPEMENHGLFIRALAARIAPGTVLGAVIDESRFRAHFAGQHALDERVAGRVAQWRAVLGDVVPSPMLLDLSQTPGTQVLERFERALMSDGELVR